MLSCPHCGHGLSERAAVLACEGGHSFDIARQGYVNLLAHKAPSQGDSAEMIAARDAVLSAGHFQPLADMLAETSSDLVAGHPSGGVLDLGAGTGHYAAAVLDALPDRAGLCLDLSVYAARRAARAHTRAGAAVCDVWARLPVRESAGALALSVFAPRNGPELARVLGPDGSALVAVPSERHLQELVEPLDLVGVDMHKRERVEAAMLPLYGDAETKLEYQLSLGAGDLELLVAMGPSSRHVDPADVRARLADFGPTPVTISVELLTFRH
jgi:23S rRNA (guanine745-N1)-methyltransferase